MLLVIVMRTNSIFAGCGLSVYTICPPTEGKITSSSCTYTAVPNTGYKFSHWTLSISSISSYTKEYTENPICWSSFGIRWWNDFSCKFHKRNNYQ